MLGVNLPFRPRVLARKIALAALSVFAFGNAFASDAAPAAKPGEKFLKLSPEARYWYLHGALLTTAHLIGANDKAKGDCAAAWYVRDKENKQQLIQATIAKYPESSPTTIVLTLLSHACGPLKLEGIR